MLHSVKIGYKKEKVLTTKGSICHKFKGINLDIDYEISDCYYGDMSVGKDFEITAVRVEGSDVDIMALLTDEQVQTIADSITCE